MTQSVDNSEWVMQGVIRDPITGALLRVNADGSINVSGGGGTGTVGTGTTVTGAASITLNSNGIQFNGVGLAGTATAATNATLTLNSAGLSISIAAAGAATNAVGLNTAQTNVTWTVNTSGISLNAAGYAGIGFTSTTTAGTAVVGTLNTAGFSAAYPVPLTTGRASTDALGLNTAGTNITWTANSVGVSINAGGYAGTVTAATNASVTVNSAGVSINIPQVVISSFQNANIGASSVTLNGASASQAVAFNLPQAISASFIRIPAQMTTASTAIVTSATSTQASGAIYSTWNAVVYSVGIGASSKSLISVASGQGLWTYMNSISAQGSQASYTQSFVYHAEGVRITSSTQYSSSDAVSYPFNSSYLGTIFSGNRWIDIPFATSLSAGPYWLVFGYSSSSATNVANFSNLTANNVVYSNHYANSVFGNGGIGVMGSTNRTSGGLMGAGSFSTAGGGTTASFDLSFISTFSNNAALGFQILRSA